MKCLFPNTKKKGGFMSITVEAQSNPPRILRLPEVVKRTGLPRASIYQQTPVATQIPPPVATSKSPT
jgi:predicted DNA-binding transcriptional regulator AlpA